MSFRPIIDAGDYVCIDRPPHNLSEAKERDTGRPDEDITDASCTLLPISIKPYCVRSVTDTVVIIFRDGVATGVSTDRVTKVPAGLVRRDHL